MTKTKSLFFVMQGLFVGGCLIAPSMRQQMEEAVFERDFGRMEKLFQEGFPIDSAITADMQSTPLHLAACFADADMIRYLLDKGASPFVKDAYGQRPIDYPYSQCQTNICKLLSVKAQRADCLIDGIPEPVLESAFRVHKILQRKTFVKINGHDPSISLLNWLQSKGFNYLTAGAFVLSRNKYSGKEEWRDKKTGEVVSLCEVRIKQISESKYECQILFWADSEKVKYDTLAYSFEVKKEYGYWFDGK